MLIVITEYRYGDDNAAETSKIVSGGDFDIWHSMHGRFYDCQPEHKETMRSLLRKGKELVIGIYDPARDVDHTTIKKL